MELEDYILFIIFMILVLTPLLNLIYLYFILDDEVYDKIKILGKIRPDKGVYKY